MLYKILQLATVFQVYAIATLIVNLLIKLFPDYEVLISSVMILGTAIIGAVYAHINKDDWNYALLSSLILGVFTGIYL